MRCGDGDFLSMMKAKELELGGGGGDEQYWRNSYVITTHEKRQRKINYGDVTPRW